MASSYFPGRNIAGTFPVAMKRAKEMSWQKLYGALKGQRRIIRDLYLVHVVFRLRAVVRNKDLLRRILGEVFSVKE